MVCVADPMARLLVTALRQSEEAVPARPVAIGQTGRSQIVRVLKGVKENSNYLRNIK
jgi:hypothetical protein